MAWHGDALHCIAFRCIGKEESLLRRKGLDSSRLGRSVGRSGFWIEALFEAVKSSPGEWLQYKLAGQKRTVLLSSLFLGGLDGERLVAEGVSLYPFFFFRAFETSITYNQYTNFIYDPQFVERGGEHSIVIFTSSIVTEQRYSWIFVSRSGRIKAYGRRTGRGTKGYVLVLVRFCSHISSLSLSIQLTKRGWTYRGSRNHTKTPVQKKNPRGNSVNHTPPLPVLFFFHRLPQEKKGIDGICIVACFFFGRL